MRLIKPAIVVLALTVLVNSIGSLLLGWQLNSLTSSLCMLLLGLILLQAQNSGPGERSLPPSGVRLLGAVGVILSGLMVARGLYRSDVDVLLALPALGLLGYVLARNAVLDMRRSESGPPHASVAAARRPARVRRRRVDVEVERPVEADGIVVGLGDNLPRHTGKGINERPPDSVAT